MKRSLLTKIKIMFEKESRKFVLLIDDDMDEQQFIVDAFAEVSPAYRVICFDNGKRGLYFLQQLPEEELPCLIVLDYDMPLMNGADVLVQLLQMPRLKNIPVVIHSASAVSYDPYLKGAKALLKKANTWKGMKENVKRFLFYKQEIVVL